MGKLKKRDPAPLPKPKEVRRAASEPWDLSREAFALLLERLMEAFTSVAPGASY